ncbi:hypothetical protein MnTg02_02457 [bacterium MnTg02]|nr:hypothetical protein MnTg02_02457 [bacterium MnTg02]
MDLHTARTIMGEGPPWRHHSPPGITKSRMENLAKVATETIHRYALITKMKNCDRPLKGGRLKTGQYGIKVRKRTIGYDVRDNRF